MTTLHEQAHTEAERIFPKRSEHTAWIDSQRRIAYERGYRSGHEAATRARVATGPSMDIVTHGVLGDWGKTHAVVDALIDAGYGSKPHTRVVTTVTELDALPVGSVVLNDRGVAWQKRGANDRWYCSGLPSGIKVVPYLPARVLHEPEEGR